VLFSRDDQLASLGLDPLQEATVIAAADGNVEAAPWTASPRETADVLRAYIDQGVASYMEGPCHDVAMSGYAIMPRFSDLFDGPVFIDHPSMAIFVLLDARSPTIESLLGP
jgi:hypothetical protein